MEGDLDHDSVYLLCFHWAIPNDFERSIAPRQCVTLL